jgi:hypothetical protein
MSWDSGPADTWKTDGGYGGFQAEGGFKADNAGGFESGDARNFDGGDLGGGDAGDGGGDDTCRVLVLTRLSD